ncbi:MAG TPA: N-acetylmuramoyl-L-alanine amidase [Lacunisphaera sp.]|jgi:N-acetylmuramoyl-L-alanine amidase|nr:N-acetylmuramoyl-L-alanine amidase [Lacunisphaera sp.]
MRGRLLLRSCGRASAGLLALTLLLPARATAASELWPVTRLHNADFVSLRDVADRFGFKPAWSKPEVEFKLEDAGGRRCTFEANQRDFYLDGLRIFLGDPVVLHGDTLWVSKLDVIKIVAPLFRPADHTAPLPAITRHVIVLDAGHGGIDQGTENRRANVTEKAATLDVALRLEKILTLQGWKVLMIRTEDRELSKDKKTDLQMRDEFANANRAELFLSIHFNSAPESITGVETYAMTPQFMLSSADDTGDAMTRVAFPSNRFDFANLLFGAELHRALRQALKTPDRGFKRGRLAVLRMLDCPGALVECAYLSNDAEARRVATPEFRQQIAEALARGVQNYAALPATLDRN